MVASISEIQKALDRQFGKVFRNWEQKYYPRHVYVCHNADTAFILYQEK